MIRAMARTFGTAIIDEYPFPIVDIMLADGRITFQVEAVVTRDVRWGPGTIVRILGADGQPVAVHRWTPGSGANHAKAGASVTMYLPVGFVEFTGPAKV
jgi:hypothetical protein